jgi:hypothetical protein
MYAAFGVVLLIFRLLATLFCSSLPSSVASASDLFLTEDYFVHPIVTSSRVQGLPIVATGDRHTVVACAPLLDLYFNVSTVFAPAMPLMLRVAATQGESWTTQPVVTFARTPEAAPASPFVVRETQVSGRAVTLLLEPPSIPNGAMVSARLVVNGTPASPQSFAGQSTVLLVPLSAAQQARLSQYGVVAISIPSLAPASAYAFLLSACTHAGCGPGANFSLVTGDEAPETIDAPLIRWTAEVGPSGRRMAVLEWRRPSPPPSVELRFEVFVNATGSFPACVYNGSATTVSVEAGLGDTFAVRVVNSMGVGMFSREASVDVPTSASSSGPDSAFENSYIIVGIAVGCGVAVTLILVIRKHRSRLSLTTFVPPLPDAWELPRSSLVVLDKVGEGAFSVVFRGALSQSGTGRAASMTTKMVAIKQLARRFLTEQDHRDFFAEMHAMKLLSVIEHRNVSDCISFLLLDIVILHPRL